MAPSSLEEWQNGRNRVTTAKYKIEDEMIALEERAAHLAAELKFTKATLNSKSKDLERVSAEFADFQNIPRPTLPSALPTHVMRDGTGAPRGLSKQLFPDPGVPTNGTATQRIFAPATNRFSPDTPKHLEPLSEDYRTVLYEIDASGKGTWTSFYCGRCGANARSKDGGQHYFSGIKGITSHVKIACAYPDEQYAGEKKVLAECKRRVLSPEDVLRLRRGETVPSVAMVIKTESIVPSTEQERPRAVADGRMEDGVHHGHRRPWSATDVATGTQPSIQAESRGFEHGFLPQRRATMGEKRYRDRPASEWSDDNRPASEGEVHDRPAKQQRIDEHHVLWGNMGWQTLNSSQ